MEEELLLLLRQINERSLDSLLLLQESRRETLAVSRSRGTEDGVTPSANQKQGQETVLQVPKVSL